MQIIKHFAIGFSVGLSGAVFGLILGFGIALHKKRIEITWTKK